MVMKEKLTEMLLEFGYNSVMEGLRDYPDGERENLAKPLPNIDNHIIWDDMSFEGKIEVIKSVWDKRQSINITHSQYCSPLEQAAGYYLIMYALDELRNSGELFDDLDFIYNLSKEPYLEAGN